MGLIRRVGVDREPDYSGKSTILNEVTYRRTGRAERTSFDLTRLLKIVRTNASSVATGLAFCRFNFHIEVGLGTPGGCEVGSAAGHRDLLTARLVGQ